MAADAKTGLSDQVLADLVPSVTLNGTERTRIEGRGMSKVDIDDFVEVFKFQRSNLASSEETSNASIPQSQHNRKEGRGMCPETRNSITRKRSATSSWRNDK